MRLTEIICVIMLIVAAADSRTIKTKILTSENGTKELVVNEGSTVPEKDIEHLIRNLQNMNISVSTGTTEDPPSIEPPLAAEEEIPAKNKTSRELNEKIMMKHWNSLTEVGWNEAYFRKPIRTMYVNNTRILQFAPVSSTELPEVLRNFQDLEGELPVEEEDERMNQTKIGRRIWDNDVENDEKEEEETVTDLPEETEESKEVDEAPPVNNAVDLMKYMYQCSESSKEGFFKCVSTKLKTLIWKKFDSGIDSYLKFFDEDECSNSTARPETSENAERAFLYRKQKKFIYTVLLPLTLVALVKYLMVLPFMIFGMLVLKSLLFGVMSVGTAGYHSIGKKSEFFYPRIPVKRYRHVEGLEFPEDGPGIAPGSNLLWAQAPIPVSEGTQELSLVPLYDKYHA